MLRHNTPQELLDRFIEIFNESFTWTHARESYLASVSKFRDQLMKNFGEAKNFDQKSQQFSSKLKVTADLVRWKTSLEWLAEQWAGAKLVTIQSIFWAYNTKITGNLHELKNHTPSLSLATVRKTYYPFVSDVPIIFDFSSLDQKPK